jgi:hypothetical protein
MRTIGLGSPRMKILLCTLLLTGAIVSVRAQTARSQGSPVQEAGEFWKVETSGGRLTSEGWYEASTFFVRSSLPPENKIVNVIRNGLGDHIEETARTATWAEVSITTDMLGQIDSSLRFKPSLKHGTAGVLLIRGPALTFDLVLTDRQWKLNGDGARAKESVLSPQWLITCGGETTWINLDVAIAYVNKVQAETSSPAIRKNAGQALQQLKHLQ